MSSSHKTYISSVLIILNHVVGLLGLNSSYASLFANISWLNLLITFFLIAWCNGPVTAKQAAFFFIVFAGGMLVEITGVNTGFPFGNYHYTAALGKGVYGVPLIIGLNWVLLTYCTANLTQLIVKHLYARIILASLLMVGIDLLLEGFATRHYLWVWENSGIPPYQNYFAWFTISIPLQVTYFNLVPNYNNRTAQLYIAVLILFLTADQLLSLTWHQLK